MSTDAADGDGDGDDDDDDDGAPTTLPPQPSPSAHPVQEKISRSGEPLTLIKETRFFCFCGLRQHPITNLELSQP